MAASYTLIFNTILFCIIRIVTTLRLRRTWGWDDLLLASALFLAIGQTVVEEKAANSGLGKHFDSLTDKRKDLYFKVGSGCCFGTTVHKLIVIAFLHKQYLVAGSSSVGQDVRCLLDAAPDYY